MTETRDSDRSWRKWAPLAVVGILLAGAVLGFLALPLVQQSRVTVDAFDAICRAIGIAPGSPAVPQPVSAGAPAPASLVAWTPATLEELSAAEGALGAEVAAEVCVACHGENGFSPDPQFPMLLGQSATAIYKQLHDYRSGKRVSEIMQPIVAGLSDEQIRAVAVFYASLARGALDPQGVAMARDPVVAHLVEFGDPARALPPCASCHGLRAGGPIETPTLAGQHRDYLTQQLVLFADGSRHNDLYGRMRAIAGALTPEEITRLSSYYAGLR